MSLRFIAILACAGAGTGTSQVVIDSVDVGGWNVAGLTFNARAGVVYGGCFYGHSFFAIACSTNEIVSQFEVVRPNDIAYAPAVHRAYCGFANQGEDSILVIDGSTHTRVKAIPVLYTGDFEMDTVGNRLYFTCYTDDCVGVLDCWADSVLDYIPIPGEPISLTINTRRRKLYCQNDVDMTVSVIDMNTNQVIRNVSVGSWFFAQCYSEAADKYYCNGAQGVAVVCGSGDTLIRQIRLPQGYSAEVMVAVEPESLVMVATNSGGTDSIFVVSAVNDSIAVALHVGRQSSALAYSPRSQLVYCASAIWDDLSVVAADGSRVLSHVGVGDGPQSLAGSWEYEKLYVGCGRQWVYVVQDRLGVTYEPANIEHFHHHEATVVSAALPWPEQGPASLLDVSGRVVAQLRPGRNDLRALAPGVYTIVASDARYRGKVVKVR